MAGAVALGIGVLGVAGVLFTALKFNRDDTTAIVHQQTEILTNFKTLNDELRAAADALRAERDNLRAQVEDLTGQVSLLREELRAATARIERRLDD